MSAWAYFVYGPSQPPCRPLCFARKLPLVILVSLLQFCNSEEFEKALDDMVKN